MLLLKRMLILRSSPATSVYSEVYSQYCCLRSCCQVFWDMLYWDHWYILGKDTIVCPQSLMPGTASMVVFSAANWNMNYSNTTWIYAYVSNQYFCHLVPCYICDLCCWLQPIWCQRSILPLEKTLLAMVWYILWNCVHVKNTSWQ